MQAKCAIKVARRYTSLNGVRVLAVHSASSVLLGHIRQSFSGNLNMVRGRGTGCDGYTFSGTDGRYLKRASLRELTRELNKLYASASTAQSLTTSARVSIHSLAPHDSGLSGL